MCQQKIRLFSMFEGQTSPEEKIENVSLPATSDSEHVAQDYATTSLSVKAHSVSFLRKKNRNFMLFPIKD
jgi:error-prone DNA polymerase